MSILPYELRDYLLAPSLQPLWSALRMRLQRNGHAVGGSVAVQLDDDGADRLSGLLGRAVGTGVARVSLVELDACLRASAAERGLLAVVAQLTGVRYATCLPSVTRPGPAGNSSGPARPAAD